VLWQPPAGPSWPSRSRFGVGRTRPGFGRPRWLPDGVHADGRIRWRRTDLWDTGFADITGDQALLGSGRWPDPRRGARRAARRVDRGGPLLLVILAIKTVAAVRPRVTRNMLGCNVSPASTSCRLLLRGRERLSQAGLTRKWNVCVDDDPTAQILFAWIAKEAFRAMCATGHSQRALRGPQTTDMGVLSLVGSRRYFRPHDRGRDHRDVVAAQRGVSSRPA
jgi:hypothetical protein